MANSLENMAFWNALRVVPAGAKKKITGGRLKGFTDIKPQWRYQRLTETFGPCGIGWRFTIDRLWLESGAGDQQVAFAEVSLFFSHEGKWSHAVQGVGGSMLVVQEKGGLHTSDEAYKMAVTDALGTAAKMIGLAADVYMGHDDSKYNGQPPKTPKKAAPRAAAPVDDIAVAKQKLVAYVKEEATKAGLSHFDDKAAVLLIKATCLAKGMPQKLTTTDQVGEVEAAISEMDWSNINTKEPENVE